MLNIVSNTVSIAGMGHLRRNGITLIRFSFQLINIPVCGKQRSINCFYIGAVAFDLLCIPQGKSVIISNGENHSTHILLYGF